MSDAITAPELAPGAVHLWRFNLDAPVTAPMLSQDEQARAAKYHFERDRNRYVAGRTMLRRLLSKYVNEDPERIAFSYGEAGKPLLPDLAFNLAHSGSHALLAVNRGAQIGVDVEVVRAMSDMPAVAEYSFSPGEFRRWRSLPEEEKVDAFYRCWTRKEAYLKAIGEGIAKRLKKFEVTFETGERPRIITGAEGAWTFFDVSLEPSYVAAIACEGSPVSVHCLAM